MVRGIEHTFSAGLEINRRASTALVDELFLEDGPPGIEQ